jgi:hypothetical protein
MRAFPRVLPPPVFRQSPARRHIFFNPAGQLGNIDRLRQNWMPLDTEARLRLKKFWRHGQRKRALQCSVLYFDD